MREFVKLNNLMSCCGNRKEKLKNLSHGEKRESGSNRQAPEVALFQLCPAPGRRIGGGWGRDGGGTGLIGERNLRRTNAFDLRKVPRADC